MKHVVRLGFLVLVGLFVWVSPSFAQLRKDIGTLRGKVVEVNAQKNEVTVQESGSETATSYTVSPAGQLNDVQKGNEVLLVYKKGTTTATTIKVLGQKSVVPAVPAQPVVIKQEMKQEVKKEAVYNVKPEPVSAVKTQLNQVQMGIKKETQELKKELTPKKKSSYIY